MLRCVNGWLELSNNTAVCRARSKEKVSVAHSFIVFWDV